MAKRYEQNPTEEVELVEGTYFDKQTGNIHYQIIDDSDKHELVYRELKKLSLGYFRYSKTAGERYGRGPVLLALPDIKSLNTTKNLGLKNASCQLVVYLLPVMMVF